MRVSDVVRMGKEYLIFGLAAAVLFVAVLFVGYFLVYKKLMKGRKTFTAAGAAKAGILVCYLAVIVGATLLGRPTGYVRINLQPFSSYRQAWNTQSMSEWSNLIFNILMFVPLGIWLPVLGGYFRRFWCTYLTGFGLSVLIEAIQLAGKCGVAEFDDVLNNTLGIMIGFGVYALAVTLWNRSRYKGAWHRRERGRRYPLWKALVLQIPLIFTCGIFAICGLVYYFQPYGNLPYLYSTRMDMSQVQLINHVALEQGTESAGIYQADVAGKEEVHKKAEEIFTRLGTQILEKRNDYYDSTALFYSTDNRYGLWLRYMGMTMDLTDFDALESAGKSGFQEAVIRTALEEYGIEAVFEDTGDGNYRFQVHMLEQDDRLIDGELTCCYTENGSFSSITNNLISCDKTDTVDIISEREAFQEIEEGKFQSYNPDLKVLEINKVELTYSLDTKGFYRPMYLFHVSADGQEDTVAISALKR